VRQLVVGAFSIDRGFAVRSHPSGAADPTQARAEGSEVTPTLLLARRVIIQWVTVRVTPFEFAFDMIEAELRRRGINLSNR
jgi:hypothetical protein